MPLKKEMYLQSMTIKEISEKIWESVSKLFVRIELFHYWTCEAWPEELAEICRGCKELRLYFCDIAPPIMVNIIPDLLPKVFEYFNTFDKVIRRYNLDEERYYDIRHICLCVLGSILFPCFDHYDLRKCDKFAFEIAVDCLQMVSNIKKLTLPHISAEISEERFSVVIGLKEVSYLNYCTNEFLDVIAISCPEIKVLNLRGSKKVDNSSVGGILRLQSLEFLDISSSSINSNGYETLLIGLANVKNISWADPIESIINNIPVENLSKITQVDVKIVTTESLCLQCPNISELKISFCGQTVDLGRLYELKCLKKLHLYEFEMQPNNGYELLHLSGENLEELKFERVKDLDCARIIVSCTNLKKMSIEDCHLHMSRRRGIVETMSHFKNLEILKIVSAKNTDAYYTYIYYYKNLQNFKAYNITEMDDIFINGIVRNGGFRNLVSFKTKGCPLGVRTIELLMENCEQLCEIGYIRFWDNIDPGAIKILQDKLGTKNIALKLVFRQENKIFYDEIDHF